MLPSRAATARTTATASDSGIPQLPIWKVAHWRALVGMSLQAAPVGTLRMIGLTALAFCMPRATSPIGCSARASLIDHLLPTQFGSACRYQRQGTLPQAAVQPASSKAVVLSASGGLPADGYFCLLGASVGSLSRRLHAPCSITGLSPPSSEVMVRTVFGCHKRKVRHSDGHRAKTSARVCPLALGYRLADAL